MLRYALILIISGLVAPTMVNAQAFQQRGNYAQAQATGELRDANGRLMGRIVARPDGNAEARSASNTYLGVFVARSNQTFNYAGQFLGQGNQLGALIANEFNRSTQTAMVPNAMPNQGSAPGTVIWNESRNAQSQERGVVLPEVQSRWARHGAVVTQDDRRIAIDAVQQAGENRGTQYNWRNPQTGHSGTYLVYPDQKMNDTYYHGKLVPCYRATMTLNAGGETDVQRQIVCKMPHNSVWTTVQVETD